ncbi:MAG: hypothetical protein FJ100_13480 [Deltaproteobacteria bacterium]|nr:hypothetical protein [Deltaproteobacteria bacterium]
MTAVRSYEELEGARDREVFFRAPRYRSDAFTALQVGITVWDAHGRSHACELLDVSTGGVAVSAPGLEGLAVGALLPRLHLSFDQVAAYEGAARVASSRTDGTRRILGLSLVDGPMNLDDVLQLRDVKNWSAVGNVGSLATRPWQVAGYTELKAMVAEVRLLLDEAQVQYAQMERELPWQVVHGETATPARAQLVERVRQEFVQPWLRAIYACDAALRQSGWPDDPTAADGANRMREFSLRLLQPAFLQGPIVHRAATKPLGYPGDYGVMRMVYEQPFEGPTLFAKAMHQCGWSMACTQAVRNRKDLLRDKLAERLAEKRARGQPLRVVSVAAGPAQEVYELLRDHTLPTDRVALTLFEQDREALTYAHRRMQRVADPRTLPDVKVALLQDSIRRLLHDPTLFAQHGPFDVILCAGLFDYLPDATAVRLQRQLYALLEAGGELYVGNLVPENPCRWMLEHHLDWRMIHRSREGMCALAAEACPQASLRIEEEPERCNPFVVLRRP